MHHPALALITREIRITLRGRTLPMVLIACRVLLFIGAVVMLAHDPASWPDIASRSALARPRVVSSSLRVAMYDGHIVPPSVLRQAPTPLHISTADAKPLCCS